MATGNGNGNQTQNNNMSRTTNNGGGARIPESRNQRTSQFKIVDTNEMYTGMTVNLGGEVYTTKGGAYEGIFSKLLTVVTAQDGAELNNPPRRRRAPDPNPNIPAIGGDGGIVIDTPGNNQETNQGGGGGSSY